MNSAQKMLICMGWVREGEREEELRKNGKDLSRKRKNMTG